MSVAILSTGEAGMDYADAAGLFSVMLLSPTNNTYSVFSSTLHIKHYFFMKEQVKWPREREMDVVIFGSPSSLT